MYFYIFFFGYYALFDASMHALTNFSRRIETQFLRNTLFCLDFSAESSNIAENCSNIHNTFNGNDFCEFSTWNNTFYNVFIPLRMEADFNFPIFFRPSFLFYFIHSVLIMVLRNHHSWESFHFYDFQVKFLSSQFRKNVFDEFGKILEIFRICKHFSSFSSFHCTFFRVTNITLLHIYWHESGLCSQSPITALQLRQTPFLFFEKKEKNKFNPFISSIQHWALSTLFA